MSVPPYIVNGRNLGPQEWHDALFLCFGIDPPDLPPRCDVCGAMFSISHTLYCKKAGLITTRHKKFRLGVTNMVERLPSSCTCTTNTSSIHVTSFRRKRPSHTSHRETKIHHPTETRQIIKGNSLSATSFSEGCTILMTCVLLILMPSPTRTSCQRNTA